MENQSRKKVLLDLCRRITKAKPESIEILRTTPICNIKTVQRKAKNIKDPNPLSSMMSTINTKYPISIDSAKAREFRIPQEFLSSSDAHQYGRRMCKLETIEWFLENSPPPSPELEKTISILFESKTKEAKTYYTIDWKRARITFGETYLKRESIQTQPTIVEVPRSLRIDYLMRVMMPEHSIHISHLSKVILEKLEQIRNLTAEAKQTIQSQLRVLLNAMDPKMRTLPCLPGEPMEINKIRHCFASSSHYVKVPTTHLSKDRGYGEFLSNLGKALYLSLRNGKNPLKLASQLMSSTYQDLGLKHVIELERDREDIYTKYLLIFLGFSVTSNKELYNVRFTPLTVCSDPVLTRNRVGTYFAQYYGLEKIQFEGETCKGLFTRNGQSITGLVLNKADANSIRNTVASIAVFLKRDFAKSAERSIRKMEEEAYYNALATPWEVIGLTAAEWKNCVHNHSSLGVFSFQEEVEMTPALLKKGKVYRSKIVFEDGDSIDVRPPRITPSLPRDYRIDGVELIDYLHPGERLKRKLRYYASPDYFDVIRECIIKRDFTHGNMRIMEGVPLAQRGAVASFAQTMAVQSLEKKSHAILIAFYYLFSYSVDIYLSPPIPVTLFVWEGSYTIDLRLGTGFLHIAEAGIMLSGVVYQQADPERLFKMIPSLLPGFKMLPKFDETAKRSTIVELLERKNIPSGHKFNISLYNRDITVIRDLAQIYEVTQTLNRQIYNLMIPEVLTRITSGIKRKRGVEEGTNQDSSDVGVPGPSRPRVELETFEGLSEDELEDI